MAAFGRALPAMEAGEIVPRGQDFATVGHLYRSIEAGIAHLADKYGERWLFVGPPRAQATQTALRLARTDPGHRRGLGAAGHRRDPGAGRGPARGLEGRALRPVRRRSWTSTSQLREANPAFDPVRPVVVVNVRPAERDVDVPLVTDPLARQVMDLFNVSYEILLQILQRFFAHTEETDAQLKVLADATVNLMFEVRQAARQPGHHAPGGPGIPGPHRRAQLRAVLRVRLRAAAPRGRLDPAHRTHRRSRGVLRARRPLRPRGRRRLGPSGPPCSRSPIPWPPTCRPGPPGNLGSSRGPRHPAGPRRSFLPNGPGLCPPR